MVHAVIEDVFLLREEGINRDSGPVGVFVLGVAGGVACLSSYGLDCPGELDSLLSELVVHAVLTVNFTHLIHPPHGIIICCKLSQGTPVFCADGNSICLYSLPQYPHFVSDSLAPQFLHFIIVI